MPKSLLVVLFLVSVGMSACYQRGPFLPPASTSYYADCNEDGQFTWQELSKTTYGVEGETKDRAFTFANFTQADANGNDRLTLTELREWFKDKKANGYNFERTCN